MVEYWTKRPGFTRLSARGGNIFVEQLFVITLEIHLMHHFQHFQLYVVRAGVKGSGGQERRLVSQLMTLLDSLHETGNLVVIGATNRPQAIEPSLRRAGRFDKEASTKKFSYNSLQLQFLTICWNYPLVLYNWAPVNKQYV